MPVPTAFDRLFPKRPRRVFAWSVAAMLLLVLAAGAMLVHGLTERRIIASSGGIYFIRGVALNVPAFRQADPRWHGEQLGQSDDTIGRTGCALTSAAMVLKSYGIDTDPHRLNAFLIAHHGYTGNGFIIWEKAAKLGTDVKKAYEDLPSYWRIDHQLMKGNPVIVRIHFPAGGMHFVVIAGKRGFDYLILDPGAGWKKGLYPLRDLTPRIDGLRYYRCKPAQRV